jgi:hypothetical protein
MIIDCASCVGRPTECGDCVVSVVLGSHPGGVDLDSDEQTALAVLAGSGLVPPLRLMSAASAESSVEVSASEGQGLQGSRRGTATKWSRRQRAG